MPSAALFAVFLAAAAVSLPAMAESTTAPATKSTIADVPVAKVALFSSGVGYFEHAGTVAGDAETTLSFKTEQINDVLKSLLLADLDGGTVSSVSYQSQDPIDRTLKNFEIDLSGEPTMRELLKQLRGAEVTVTTSGNQFVGKILGVDVRKRVLEDGKAAVDKATLNLLTSGGIKSVAIDDALSIVLADPKLNDELNQALAAIAAARDADKKSVTVHFGGAGPRRVRLGYVVATPIWKASYRLSIGDDSKSNLQGWAIVENQTDGDWKDINLSLVSGRPMSFSMDLYEPMYLTRPEAKLELFAGLTPQTYAESRDADAMVAQSMPAPAPMASMAPSGETAKRRSAGGAARGGMLEKEAAMDFAASSAVAARATGGAIGELFEYAIPHVTIARQSSAMVPIVSEPIEVAPVSIFNSKVLARYPLTGARVKNTTDKHLLQGPITVFNAGGYAGDAQVNNVPPGQTRLISFGVDLQTIVDADKVDNSSDLIGVKIVNGTIEATSRTVQSRHYQLANKSPKKKLIVIEHPKQASNWSLVETAEPNETTDAIYRFDRPLEAGKSEDFVVKQQTTNGQALAILNADISSLGYFVKHGTTPPAVREAILKAMTLRTAQADLDRQLGERQAEIAAIDKEQSRLRENMKTVDKGSAYYTRLMKKLDEQESTIEKTRATIDDLTTQRDAKRKEFEAYVSSLSVG